MGTSWISRKGAILEKGGWSRKVGVWTPLPIMYEIEHQLLLLSFKSQTWKKKSLCCQWNIAGHEIVNNSY